MGKQVSVYSIWLVVLILVGCASTPSYMVPLNERSRVYAYGASSAIEAVQSVFSQYGFEISHVDEESGMVFTEFTILNPGVKEIGGTIRAQWTAMVKPVSSGSLVSVQYLVEKRSAELWADSPIEINQVHRIYMQALRDIESILLNEKPAHEGAS